MKHLLLVTLILSNALANGQELTRVLGSNIYLNIPEGFELDSNSLNTYYNFKKEYISARVIQQNYHIIKPLASWELYKNKNNYKLVREEEIMISGYNGIIFECIVDGINHSYQITVGDSTKTYQIIASCYKNSSLVRESLEEMFKTIKIDANKQIPWNDQIGFNVAGKQDFLKGAPSYNSIQIVLDDNLQIDLTRISGTNFKSKTSEQLLLEKGNIGWSKRQERRLSNSDLDIKKTSLNGQKTYLLKAVYKDTGKEFLLVEGVIEGQNQRIFISCHIKKDLENKEKTLIEFLNRLQVN